VLTIQTASHIKPYRLRAPLARSEGLANVPISPLSIDEFCAVEFISLQIALNGRA
jgi:hypothetical protein